MSVTNLTITPGDSKLTASWQLSGTGFNAVIAKIRPTGSNLAWSNAEAVELTKTTTSHVFTGLTNGQEYDVQVDTVSFQSNKTASATPKQSGITVNANPTGPAVPSGGWHVAMADAFAGTTLSSLWGPNSDNNNGRGPTAVIPGPNADEVAAYAASQVTVNNALHLTAISAPNCAPHCNYKSGVVISQNYVAGEPGQQGFPITGFRFVPQVGVIWALEAIITMPDMSNPGQDPGWWLSTSSWVDEIDMPEMWAYGNKPYGYGMAWIYNTSQYAEEEKSAYGDPVETDGKPHRWTNVFDGIAKRWEVYVDGTHRTDLSMAWPPSFSTTPLYMVFTHGMRNDYGTPPTWTTGSVDMVVHSAAAYTSGPATFTGGGIAPGTVVA